MLFPGRISPTFRPWLSRVPRVLLGAIACLGFSAGCKPQVATTLFTGSTEGTFQSDDTLDAARETLRREGGLQACRAAIQSLNAYLIRHPEEKPPALTEKSREFLVNEVGLDDEELSEVNSATF